MYRKQIILFVVIIGILVGSIILYLSLRTEKPTPVMKTPTVTLRAPATLPASLKQKVINNTEKIMIRKHGEGTYTATVREGSYKREADQYGVLITNMLIDISETKETYHYSQMGGDDSSRAVEQLVCAVEADQAAHPSTCIGSEDE
jgi:hypothetical protein